MSTNNIIVSGSLIPSSTDTPLDVRTRINSLDDISSIENPYVGLQIYNLDDEKVYIVKSLKAKLIGAITVANAQIDEYEEYGNTANFITVNVDNLTNYTTTSAMNILLSAKADTSTLSSYVLTSALNTKLEDYYNKDTIDNKLSELETSTAISLNCTLSIRIPSDEDNDNLTCYLQLCESSTFGDDDDIIELNSDDNGDIMLLGYDGGFNAIPSEGISFLAYGGLLIVNLATVESVDKSKIYYARASFYDDEDYSSWKVGILNINGYIGD